MLSASSSDTCSAARFSRPLSDCFPSHGDALLRIVDLTWRTPSGARMILDPWQRDLVRRVLELYPEGHPLAGTLRYRQVFVSLARQNGKSVLGAIFGLYGLLREIGGLVIGLASTAEQARIIYKRLMAIIRANKSLRRKFKRLTDTRGIERTEGGYYEIKPAKSDAVQGLDVSVAIVDELHLVEPALWDDMVNGSRARRNGIVIGVTTAGDEGSELLLNLYKIADEPDATRPEQFGFFIFEAPEARLPDDDDEALEYIRAANPAAAAGRIDAHQILRDARVQARTGGPSPVIRYVLNRFVSSLSSFILPDAWARVARPPEATFPTNAPPVFVVDRTPEWTFATITASVLEGDVVHTEIAASLTRPDLDQLVRVCVAIDSRTSGALFVVDGLTLKDLGKELRTRGLDVRLATLSDVTNASARLFARVAQQTIQHAGDELLAAQIPRTIRKSVGEGFRISRKDSSVEIDAVLSTAVGVLFAEQQRHDTLQLY